MEREARFCKGYYMRVDFFGLYLDLMGFARVMLAAGVVYS